MEYPIQDSMIFMRSHKYWLLFCTAPLHVSVCCHHNRHPPPVAGGVTRLEGFSGQKFSAPQTQGLLQPMQGVTMAANLHL